jgi:hypothetical protein
MPSAAAFAASSEDRLPLNESIAMIIFISDVFMGISPRKSLYHFCVVL